MSPSFPSCSVITLYPCPNNITQHEIQVLTMATNVLYEMAFTCFSFCISYQSWFYSLSFSQACLPVACLLMLSPLGPWLFLCEGISSDSLMTHSLTSFRFSIQCHLIQEPFPEPPSNIGALASPLTIPHPLTHFHFPWSTYQS